MTLTDLEVDILRGMSPARKLDVMNALIRQAYDLKVAALTERWPDLTEGEIRARAKALVGGDCP